MRVAEVSSSACSNEGPSCPAVYRTSTLAPQGRARVAVAAGTYGAGCCARPLTAVVAAASEAARGSQNERFERFDTSPVNRPTYVADHLPGRESIRQPDRAELNRAALITKGRSGASGSRIDASLRPLAALLTIVRRKHGMPQRPVMQYLQGVALRRTSRRWREGGRVTVSRPSAAQRDDVDQSCPRDAPGSARGCPRRPGARRRRRRVAWRPPRPPCSGGRSRPPFSKFHQ